MSNQPKEGNMYFPLLVQVRFACQERFLFDSNRHATSVKRYTQPKGAKFIAKLAVWQSAIQSVSERVYTNGYWSM
jgi:hypothetical protein